MNAFLPVSQKDLAERGWKVESVQGVDMFPHTEHIETVAALTRPSLKKRN